MNIDIAPGKYIVAVSGGVDSMVLLDALSKLQGVSLVVAHFEHGIRDDSDEDRKLVQAAAKRYGLPFVFARGNLGTGASEAAARDARYTFLRKAKAEQGAEAIVTAHHQDDLLETAILNIIRGTGRKGLSSLASGSELIRPLLHTPKQDILDYARAHNIAWHEDSTNADDRYLRNYVRQTVIPRLGDSAREQLLAYIGKAETANPVIDTLLEKDLQKHMSDTGLDRNWFIMLPHDVSREAMAAWFRVNGIREFDRRAIERLVVFAKTAKAGKTGDINAGYHLKATRTTLVISLRSTS